jgi:hypothetical protein
MQTFNKMKKINSIKIVITTTLSLLTFIVVLSSCSCNKAELNQSVLLVGTWVEKYPEKWDGISDTLEFKSNLTVDKHFYFRNWVYKIENSNLIFTSPDGTKQKSFTITITNENEIIINNFLDRSIT